MEYNEIVKIVNLYENLQARIKEFIYNEYIFKDFPNQYITGGHKYINNITFHFKNDIISVEVKDLFSISEEDEITYNIPIKDFIEYTKKGEVI